MTVYVAFLLLNISCTSADGQDFQLLGCCHVCTVQITPTVKPHAKHVWPIRLVIRLFLKNEVSMLIT